MEKSKIIQRIEREAGIPDLVEALVEGLTPTDLQSLLLEVYRQRAQRQDPSAVLSDYLNNRFVRPAAVSPMVLVKWEQVAFTSLPPEFKSITLSPVCPLGTSSVIADIDQNRALSTARNTEVLSDSTNVLAIECAVQRREQLRRNPKSGESVHLAASHRLLRTQQYGDNPNMVPHFSAFALCSAGRTQGGLTFELAALLTHVTFYLRALRTFLGEGVLLQVAITDFSSEDRRTILSSHFFPAIQAAFPGVECSIDDARTSGKGYYDDLCFHVYAGYSGQLLELADGGVVNWTQKLLSNAKERCVISGIGSERVCTAFNV